MGIKLFLKIISTGIIFSLLGWLAVKSIIVQKNFEVVRISDMTIARAAHQTTLLSSGEVLITGGCTGNCRDQLAETEIYHPTTKSFTRIGSMHTARVSHVAMGLQNGQVLIAGGWSNGKVTATAELYDPTTNDFHPVMEMTVARGAPTATLLKNGRVLIAGGQNGSFNAISTSEVFDPVSSEFIQVGSMNSPRTGHASVLLHNGKVLLTGGQNARRGKILTTAEIFDPETGDFITTGEMSFPRHKHAAVLLNDGKVIIIGGADQRDFMGRYQSSEIFDPLTGKFSPGPDMSQPRFKLPYAVVALPGGDVVVAGGAPPLEKYDQTKKVFIPLEGEYSDSREFSTATLLPDGTVLVLGGYDHSINTSAMAWLIKNQP